MPISYQKGILNEHLQVRESAGLFDVSHMGQILISIDEKNTISLSKFIPLDFDKINFNKCYYSFLLNNDGGIIDDLIISKIKYQQKDFFYIVYNASRKKNDEEIFINHLNNYKNYHNNPYTSDLLS